MFRRKCFAYLCFVATALPAVGCAVGPDYVRPEGDVPPAWTRQEREPGSAPRWGWWEQFNDPLLSELIRRGVEGNNDLKLAFERINEARAMLGFASGKMYPELDAQAAVLRSRLSEDYIVPTFDGRRTDYSYSTGAGVLWEIDLWGRIRRMIESAGSGADAAFEAWRAVLVVLQSEVALAYIELRTMQERLGYARANADLQKKTLGLARDRFRAEIAPELDVEQAALNLALTRSAIPVFELRIEQTMNRLAVLTGMHAGSLQNMLAPVRPIPAGGSELPLCLPADLLRQRPDIRRAERELAARAARIGVATADLYPSLSLGGMVGFAATADPFDAAHRTWSFGAGLRWNLFNGLRTRSLIKAEESRTRQALTGYEQTVLAAVEEVENALAAYTFEKKRRESLEESVRAATKSVELVRSMYINGLTDFQNLLEMEKTLFQQQDRLAESRGQITCNRVILYKAMGAGWAQADNATTMLSHHE